jgi:hypothetical protein
MAAPPLNKGWDSTTITSALGTQSPIKVAKNAKVRWLSIRAANSLRREVYDHTSSSAGHEAASHLLDCRCRGWSESVLFFPRWSQQNLRLGDIGGEAVGSQHAWLPLHLDSSRFACLTKTWGDGTVCMVSLVCVPIPWRVALIAPIVDFFRNLLRSFRELHRRCRSCAKPIAESYESRKETDPVGKVQGSEYDRKRW